MISFLTYIITSCKTICRILAMDGSSITDELTRFMISNNELPRQTKMALEEAIEDLRKNNNN